MKRWVYAHRVVAGDAAELDARFRAHLPELLAAAGGSPPSPPSGDGSFLVQLDSHQGIHSQKTVRVHLGAAKQLASRTIVPVTWEADPAHAGFPTFDGSVELEQSSASHVELVLVGSYEPPVGVVGLVADATVLHGVASRTVEEVLDGIADALTHLDQAPAPAPLDPVPMRVREVMSSDPLVLQEEIPLRTAAALLLHFGFAGAPVVDDHGALVGVLSEADLLEKEASPLRGFGNAARRATVFAAVETVGGACTRPARITSLDSTLHDAAREMLSHHVKRLVVVDAGEIVGVVSRHDLLKALVRSDERVRAFAAQILRELQEPAVAVQVEDGKVAVSGTISRLSRARALQDRLREIDGVLVLDTSELTWRVDDLTSVVHPML